MSVVFAVTGRTKAQPVFNVSFVFFTDVRPFVFLSGCCSAVGGEFWSTETKLYPIVNGEVPSFSTFPLWIVLASCLGVTFEEVTECVTFDWSIHVREGPA